MASNPFIEIDQTKRLDVGQERTRSHDHFVSLSCLRLAETVQYRAVPRTPDQFAAAISTGTFDRRKILAECRGILSILRRQVDPVVDAE